MTAERLGGFFVAAIVAAFGLTVLIQRRVHDARAGWNLRPVVVAAADIPASSEITYDMLSQRSLPEQFVSDSYVTPESAPAIVAKVVAFPVKQGDPIQWAHFVEDPRRVLISGCAKEIAPRLQNAVQLDGGTNSFEAAGDLARDYFSAQ